MKYATEPPLWAASESNYDAYGNVVRLQGPEGELATIDYSPGSFTYPIRQTTTVTKGKSPGEQITLVSTSQWDDRFGVVVETVDPNRRRVERELDGLGRLVLVTSTPSSDPTAPPITLQSFEYSLGTPLGSNYLERTSAINEGEYVVSRTYFDGMLRSVQEKTPAADGQWTTKHRRYGLHGVEIETLPFFTGSNSYTFLPYLPARPLYRTAYDWEGRVVKKWLEDSNGNAHYPTATETRLWDTVVTDPRGNRRTARRDGHGRIVRIEEQEGSTLRAVTRFDYNRIGNLVQVMDNAGNTTRLQYDSRGLRRAMEDPDLSNCGNPSDCPWRYAYNLSGQIIRQVDAKGQHIDFYADELGRVYHKDFQGDDDVLFSYDEGQNGLGRLSSVRNGIGNKVSYEYDNWGRTLRHERTVADSTFVLNTIHDLLGRITKVQYPTGETAEYVFDGGGRVSSVAFNGADILRSVVYDPLSRIVEIQWGNGLTTNQEYGPNEKLKSLSVGGGGDSPLHRLAYEFDEAGNTKAVYVVEEAWRRVYAYDWAGRLIDAQHQDRVVTRTCPEGLSWPSPLCDIFIDWETLKEWRWEYDEIGNMTYNSDWDTADPFSDGRYSYGSGAGPHAVTRIGTATSPHTFSYDANGFMVGEGESVGFAYDTDGNMLSVSDVSGGTDLVARFEYDGDGTRTRKMVTGSETELEIRYSGTHFEELLEDGVRSGNRYVLLGNSRVALITDRNPSKVLYLHPDVQGTIGLVTDENGEVVLRRQFAPYGELESEEGTDPGVRYGFTGAEHDRESELLHLGVRQYRPKIARFVQPDSTVPNPDDPQSLNRYAYARNNPVRYTDPSGFQEEEEDEYDPLDRHANRGELPPSPLMHVAGEGLMHASEYFYLQTAEFDEKVTVPVASWFGEEAFRRNPDMAWVEATVAHFGLSFITFLPRLLATPAWLRRLPEQTANDISVLHQSDDPDARLDAWLSLGGNGATLLGLVAGGAKAARGAGARGPRLNLSRVAAGEQRPILVRIRYTEAMARAAGDANFLRAAIEWAQMEDGVQLRVGARAATDATARAWSRRTMQRLGFDIEGRQAMHPVDSIINPYFMPEYAGYYFGNSSANLSMGAQLGNQLRGVPSNTPVFVEFVGFPAYEVAPAIAPPVVPTTWR